MALVLDVIGPEDQDPSTWFSALFSASTIPIASMIWLEGQSFERFGMRGVLWTDAGANLVMFTIVVVVFVGHGLGLRTAPITTQEIAKVGN